MTTMAALISAPASTMAMHTIMTTLTSPAPLPFSWQWGEKARGMVAGPPTAAQVLHAVLPCSSLIFLTTTGWTRWQRMSTAMQRCRERISWAMTTMRRTCHRTTHSRGVLVRVTVI